MLIDVHCHLNLYPNISEIIKEAKINGVYRIICVAMSALEFNRILELSKEFKEVKVALGIHPEEVERDPQINEKLNKIIDIIRSNKENICAIGEIGLDHYFVKDKNLYPLQREIFEHMLLLAQELSLPVNLHTKGAEDEVFKMLPSYNIPAVNIHWYSGPENLIKKGIDRGYFFSITPAIEYSPAVKKCVELVELEYLLLESDGPVKFRGQLGTPAMIKDVLCKISEIKKAEILELEDILFNNTKKIFPRAI
ncbi:MAG: TatD family hydrolase [Promethearchaeia archaeon]